MHITMIHTTIREDEKLLMEAAKKHGVGLEVVDIRTRVLNPASFKGNVDVVIERCLATTIGMHAITFFESIGAQTINTSQVAQVCEDKFATSLRLMRENIPTLPFAMAFTEEEALRAVEMLGGYPVVLKPTAGSWGRLLAKINDRDALEGVIEQKMVLGTPMHKALYFQKYVQKPGRDIRVTMVHNRVICAIYRQTQHWVTNTARGAVAKPCTVDRELEKISISASRAVGGGVLGIDVFETDVGYMINEINHTVEFKNVQRVTGVDVAGAIIEYAQHVANRT